MDGCTVTATSEVLHPQGPCWSTHCFVDNLQQHVVGVEGAGDVGQQSGALSCSHLQGERKPHSSIVVVH